MKKLILWVIDVYKKSASFILEYLFGKGCRFYPTCSQYAKEAITSLGFSRGSFISLKRIIKCHPFNPGGFDPVPTKV